MGWIADCEATGIPGDLLLPIAPHDAGLPPRGKKNINGKAPAYWSRDPAHESLRKPGAVGGWAPLPNWTAGCPVADRELSDEFQCNVGALMGQTVDHVTLCAIDLDLVNDARGICQALRPRVLAEIARVCNAPNLLVRNTVLPRAMILVGIKEGGHVGGKTVINLFHGSGKDRTELGKSELLTNGEQAVICGTHQSGVPIEWCRLDAPGVTYRVPPVADGLIVFESFAELRDTMLNVILSFEKDGISAEIAGAASRGMAIPASEPKDLAPPDAARFTALVDMIPNPSEATSQHYQNMWFALEGCRRSLRALGRLTAVQEQEMIRSVVDWCQRWKVPPTHKTPLLTREEEFAKFHRYYGTRPIVHLGWSYLCRIAQELGTTGVEIEEAQRQFTADLAAEKPRVVKRAKPPTPSENPRMPLAYAEDDGVPLAIDLIPVEAPQSDIVIANDLAFHMGGDCVYIAQEGHWMVFSPQTGWRLGRAGDMAVKEKTRKHLINYVSKFAESGASVAERWTRDEKRGCLSAAKIDAVEKTLRWMLSKNIDDIRQAMYILQTPGAAIDLRTGEVLGPMKHRTLLETRCTKVPMVPGPTPMFDDLIYNLADGNSQIAEWLLHYLGYTLLGNPCEHIFLFIWGTSRNGKSTLVRVLQAVLGNYVVVGKKNCFLGTGEREHPTEFNRLREARIACFMEMGAKENWNEERLKSFTGQDEQQARNMNMDAGFFTPEAALVFVGNDIPVLDQSSLAIRERARITGTTMTPEVIDKTFEPRMIAGEGPAILAKLAGYANAVFKNGMRLPEIPEVMAGFTKEYLHAQDAFYAWFTSEIQTGRHVHESEVAISEMKERYEAYLRRQAELNGENDLGIEHVSDKDFRKRLTGFGVVLLENGEMIRRKGEIMARGCAFKVKAVRRDIPA